MLENPHEGELYSKLDIRWGYKNLRIRKKDQHKAASKTVFGTYIPKVIYFGLTNALPMFRRIINGSFRVTRTCDQFYRNISRISGTTWMILGLIVTWKNPEGRALRQRITSMKKKNIRFRRTTECKTVLERLIRIATSEPVLRCPNPEQPFKYSNLK